MAMFSTAAEGAASIAQRCEKARQTQDGWQACCPVHDDRTPSLSITPTDDRILLKCHAGCATADVVAALGLTLADLFVGTPSSPPPARSPTRRQSAPAARAPKAPPADTPRVTAIYDYDEADEQLLHQVLRWEPGFHGEKKSFTQRRPHPTKPGVWIKNMDGVTRVLYNLPAVLKAVAAGDLIYLPEGEQDANNVIALGLTATTNAGGADQWADQYTETLRGAHLVILQDNDDSGRRHTARVTQALHGVAASLQVVELPGLAEKGDVSDWLQAGGTRAQLEEIVEQTPRWTPAALAGAAAAALAPPPLLPPRQPYVKPPLCPPLPAGALCSTSWNPAAPWLEAYADYSRQWSPRGMRSAHTAVGLWVLSTVAARRVYCTIGADRVYPSLFMALVARSTLYAKTSTVTVGRQLLQRAGCGFFLTADRTTPQALLRSMAGMVPMDYGGRSEDEQLLLRQHLAFAGQRSAYFEEWGGMLNQMRRTDSPMAEFHTFLRVIDGNQEAYTNDTIQRGIERILHPSLALLASATPHDLAPFMATGSAWWHDGFWPRFALIVPQHDEEPSSAHRQRHGHHIPGALIEPLHTWHRRLGMPTVTVEPLVDAKGKANGAWRATIGPLPQHEIGIAESVYDAYEAYNDGLFTLLKRGDIAQDYDASYGRFHDKALRVALLLAAGAGDSEIGTHHWAYAQRIVEEWRQNLHVLVGRIADDHPVSKEEQAEQKIVAYLMRVGRATARDIQRFLQSMTSLELTRMLEAMTKAGHVLQEKDGRKTVYGLLPHDDEYGTSDEKQEVPV